MADYNCSACDELRQNSSDFYINGVTDSVCTQLQNDKGFSGKSTDCEDLDDANDCLIRGMESEIDAYDACDWQEYMHKFVGNVWTVIKAIICAICGLWKFVNKHECEINQLLDGESFFLSETPSEDAYIVAGKGVSYLQRKGDTDKYSTDITFTYIGGGLARLTGGLTFHTSDFEEDTDAYEVRSVENDTKGYTKVSKGDSRSGNPNWGKTGNTVDGNELVYEVRINLKSDSYKHIQSIFAGFGQETNGHGFHVSHNVYYGGEWADGQHGRCDPDNGKPKEDGMSYGHQVPDGWVFVQMRMSYIFDLGDRDWATPRSFLGMRFDRSDMC